MKKRFIVPAICLLLIVSTAFFVSSVHENENIETTEFYVGVTFCGNTTTEAKMLIDRVKDFTNLFVLYSGPVSKNETAMTEICEYAVAADLNIVYFGDLDSDALRRKDLLWRLSWIEMAKQQWGDRFLGVHYYDEPGGIYIDFDRNETMLTFLNLDYPDYNRAANIFITGFHMDNGFEAIETKSLDAFVSDYALYWFDYVAGYDVVLAQAGWNHTLVQDIALVRGVARMQNKT